MQPKHMFYWLLLDRKPTFSSGTPKTSLFANHSSWAHSVSPEKNLAWEIEARLLVSEEQDLTTQEADSPALPPALCLDPQPHPLPCLVSESAPAPVPFLQKVNPCGVGGWALVWLIVLRPLVWSED